MAKSSTKTVAQAPAVVRGPTDKMRLITRLCAREDGATSAELLEATGENKRRSRWSLTKLAARMGYRYEPYTYEDDPLIHHCFVGSGRKAEAKQAEPAKKAAKPESNVIPLRRPLKVATAKQAQGKRAAK